MSGKQTLTPIYDCHYKKCETTRRRIFKDSNGKYKEKLEIETCEKRTLFGSPPFEANSNWKLEDLSDIDENDIQPSPSIRQRKRTGSSVLDTTESSSDFDHSQVIEKSNPDVRADAATFEDIRARQRSNNEKQDLLATDTQGVVSMIQGLIFEN